MDGRTDSWTDEWIDKQIYKKKVKSVLTDSEIMKEGKTEIKNGRKGKRNRTKIRITANRRQRPSTFCKRSHKNVKQKIKYTF
jgi:hypothetical protein